MKHEFTLIIDDEQSADEVLIDVKKAINQIYATKDFEIELAEMEDASDESSADEESESEIDSEDEEEPA